MGKVILEIPQDVDRVYRIDSEETAAAILEQLEGSSKLSKFEQAVASGAIKLPRRRSKKDSEDVLGIWADRPESGQEIARRIRDRNNGKNV